MKDFEAMEVQGIVPDMITCNALISACDKGWQPERAMKVFENIELQSIVPDVITCNSLISACDKGQQSKRAIKVFEIMRDKLLRQI